jgi:hypothetical protein
MTELQCHLLYYVSDFGLPLNELKRFRVFNLGILRKMFGVQREKEKGGLGALRNAELQYTAYS